jgi:ArsR family transcriptional regulator, lead/cadmium/zinc/bismuth-responsive transcriptional repressor
MSSVLKDNPTPGVGRASQSPNGIENGDGCAAPHLDARSTEDRRLRLLPARTVEGLADTFRVLGDPTRVRILDALATGELCVCDIASLVGISESAVSHQLRLLRGMRLVRPRRAGRLVFYAVDDHHILELLTQAMTHVEEQLSAVSSVPAAHRTDR